MAFISKGCGAGEIQVDLRAAGVPPSEWDRVTRSVRGMSEVRQVDHSYNGTLTARVSVGNLGGERLSSALRALNDTIVQIVAHKAAQVAARH